MLILRLNSSKELTCDATTLIYSNENKFDTIRVIASPLIDGKNIEDYKVELYVYNVLNKDWNTFNDCVPCDFTLDNDKYIFDTPIKSQYTAYPCIGMYCRFIGENGVVGKTNVVNIPVLYHRDNNIDVGNSIEWFEKYKADMQKDIQNSVSDISKNVLQKVGVNKRRIYFKKNCPDWTTPRIYLFTTDSMSNSSAPNLNLNGSTKEKIWDFEDSPYMIQDENEEDLYYYYIPLCQYRNVIFFCDKRDSSGWNYKTADLVIPQGYMYPSLYYWQSPIGYDGIWADKETNSFKLFIQTLSSYHIKSIYVKVDNIDTPFYNLGIQGCGQDYNGKQYYYANIPLTASDISVNITIESQLAPTSYVDIIFTDTFKLYELCYNCSALYSDQYKGSNDKHNYNDPILSRYDISLDEIFMFQTRYTASEYQLYRDSYRYFNISGIQNTVNSISSLTNLINSGNTYGNMGGKSFSYSYYKVGRMVYLSCNATFYPGDCDSSNHNIVIKLPYTMNTSNNDFSIPFGQGYFTYYNIDKERNSLVGFDVTGINSTSMKPAIQSWSSIYGDLDTNKTINLSFRVLYLSSY